MPIEGRPVVVFVTDDEAALWKRGDQALDLGWESTEDVGVRLLRLLHRDEVLAIQRPLERGLIVEQPRCHCGQRLQRLRAYDPDTWECPVRPQTGHDSWRIPK